MLYLRKPQAFIERQKLTADPHLRVGNRRSVFFIFRKDKNGTAIAMPFLFPSQLFPLLRANRYLHHTVALLFKQLIGFLNLFQRIGVGNQRCGI